MKVCILTAGKGTRNKYAEKSNKALLPIGNGTALSYITDKFPDVEIVIAVGYNLGKVVDYVADRMPQLKGRVSGVWVDNQARGPGYSLLCCQDRLQCPFVFSACDTLVLEDIPLPDENWIGIAIVTEKLPYLTVDIEDGLVKSVYDKGDKNATYNASIGLYGIKDYESFWEGLATPTLIDGEYQDTAGLNALIPHGLHTRNFTWLDIGTTEGYENAHGRFNQPIL